MPYPPGTMDYWLISDTHFNHPRLERWGGRSGDWQQQLWRGLERIPAGDVLVHLGDVCMGNDEAVSLRVTSIAARSKVLVLGNHDTKSTGWYHEHGWDFVCDGFALPYMGHSLWLSHRPEPEMGRFTENIHGHTHGNRHRAEEYEAFYRPAYHKDISPELLGFPPDPAGHVHRGHETRKKLMGRGAGWSARCRQRPGLALGALLRGR